MKGYLRSILLYHWSWRRRFNHPNLLTFHGTNMPRHSDYLLSHFMALENIHVLFYPFSRSGIYYFNDLTMAVQDMLILAKKN